VAKFLLGDFVEYLKQDATRYDLIFCSGVLYRNVGSSGNDQADGGADGSGVRLDALPLG
jgi:hypothetical protein